MSCKRTTFIAAYIDSRNAWATDHDCIRCTLEWNVCSRNNIETIVSTT